MNSLFAILFKNAILLSLITVSLLFVFTVNIDFKEINYLFIGLGVMYVLASCYEAYKLSQVKETTKKFIYFTDGFFAKRLIKISVFMCCGVLLYFSESIIKYLSFLCFLIVVSEIVVTLWRYTKNLCFIAFENQTLIISTNKLNIIKTSSISKIESRHGLTYIVDNQNKSFTIRTDMMKDKETFKQALSIWIETQGISSLVKK